MPEVPVRLQDGGTMPINDAPDSSAPARFAEPRAVRPDWYWSAPYIAVLIFALAMLVLVWVLQRQEGETQRNALARDVQWAEQTMRLHMQGTEENVTFALSKELQER